MKVILSAVIITILFCSCKKEKSNRWTNVAINMYDYFSNEPLGDFGITVFQEKVGGVDLGSNINTGYETREKIVENLENGHFTGGFDAEMNPEWNCKLKIDHEAHEALIFLDDPLTFAPVSFDLIKGANNSVNIAVVPASSFHFHYKNTAYFDTNDQVKLTIDNLDLSIEEELMLGIDVTPDISFAVDDGDFYKKQRLPNGDYEVRVEIIKNGVTSFDTVKFNLPASKNSIIEIFY